MFIKGFKDGRVSGAGKADPGGFEMICLELKTLKRCVRTVGPNSNSVPQNLAIGMSRTFTYLPSQASLQSPPLVMSQDSIDEDLIQTNATMTVQISSQLKCITSQTFYSQKVPLKCGLLFP